MKEKGNAIQYDVFLSLKTYLLFYFLLGNFVSPNLHTLSEV